MAAIGVETERLLGASMASSTWVSYHRGVSQFQQFRQQAGLQSSWPASSGHVAAFLAHLSIIGMAPSSISTYISAVAFVHKVNGWPDPSDNFMVKKLREGSRRQHHKPDIRRPVTADLLGKLCHMLGSIAASELEARLFRSAFLLAFFGFFRVGEITARNSTADCSQILGFNDVWFEGNDQSVMNVRLRYSKCDQRGVSVTLRFHKILGSPLCPVQAVSGYLQIRPPLGFPLLVHADGVPLTAYQFRFMLKKCLEALGVPTQGFSGHSFRIGAATSAALNGIAVSDIQSLGRWKSSAVNLYIRPNKVWVPQC